MQEQKSKQTNTVGKMTERREFMADGQRYIIYYDFEKAKKSEKSEEKKDV